MRICSELIRYLSILSLLVRSPAVTLPTVLKFFQCLMIYLLFLLPLNPQFYIS